MPHLHHLVLEDHSDFQSLILSKFNIMLSSSPEEEKIKHILHLYHLSFDPSIDLEEPQDHRRPFEPTKISTLILKTIILLIYIVNFGRPKLLTAPQRIPCATELEDVGIKFKKKVPLKTAGQLKVSFNNGKLEIPCLLVDDSKCSELRNLMALEQCCTHISAHFTEYCFFMDFLIDSANDVAILQRRGILESLLGSNSETAEMFNSLTKEVIWEPQEQYLSDVYEELMKYCSVSHHKWRAHLMQKYFTNPWTIFSLTGALLLLIFTGIQTLYAASPERVIR